MRTLPSTPLPLSPIASSRLASERSSTGRLMTMPSAPSRLWRTMRITVWRKRGSPISDEAIRSCPAREALSAGAPGWGAAARGSANGNMSMGKIKTRRPSLIPRISSPFCRYRACELRAAPPSGLIPATASASAPRSAGRSHICRVPKRANERVPLLARAGCLRRSNCLPTPIRPRSGRRARSRGWREYGRSRLRSTWCWRAG